MHIYFRVVTQKKKNPDPNLLGFNRPFFFAVIYICIYVCVYMYIYLNHMH